MTRSVEVPSSNALTVLIFESPLFPSNLGFVGRRIKLFDFETAVQMYSVDIITMETVNPDMYPLPSIELLNMQFAFARALRLRGAADLDQEEVDSSDSEKRRMYWWLNLEVEHTTFKRASSLRGSQVERPPKERQAPVILRGASAFLSEASIN
ncbi:unnamed protein product [Aspergillus oryzae var. brunneus]|uniref:Unnamed protein product n=1 Tax=Aspergillus oryzae var. brunneus TaxID=332754 RepID=A0ABQ6KZZ3_ASPOZ|nr:unnamed protein product [Aspergillus oryzae var. brunneus]